MPRKAQNVLTMTATECVEVLRKYGVSLSTKTLVDGIASGKYPFGRIISGGNGQRRLVEIFRVDFCEWLYSKIPKAGIHDAVM